MIKSPLKFGEKWTNIPYFYPLSMGIDDDFIDYWRFLMQLMIIHDFSIVYHRFPLKVTCNILFHSVLMFFHQLLMIQTEKISNNRAFSITPCNSFYMGRTASYAQSKLKENGSFFARIIATLTRICATCRHPLFCFFYLSLWHESGVVFSRSGPRELNKEKRSRL